jgi:hypothetical protein
MKSDQVEQALRTIESCDDPVKLQQIMENARERGVTEVWEAAFRRLCMVKPSAEPGTLEHAVWQSIYALEEVLKDERNRTTLLARTRQKISRDGEQRTVRDLVLKGGSAGFEMLIERGMPDLTFETLALKFPERFDAEVLEAARTGLESVQAKPHARTVEDAADRPD